MSGEQPESIDDAEDTVQKLIEMKKDFAEALEDAAETTGKTEDEVLRDWFFDEGFWAVTLDAEESIVRLQYVDATKTEQLDEVGESGDESEKNLKIFRDLREHFPPVTAGIDYLKAFVAGGGFTVGITNADDEHQKLTRDEINKLNRRVYMDEMTKGLDAIIDILLEAGYTDGVGAAEIVYEKFYEPGSFKFDEYVETTFEVTEKDSEGRDVKKTRYRPKKLDDKDWKKFKGIRQLKIVDNAYTRLKPYRDAATYEILYWTVDEAAIGAWNKANEAKTPKEFAKLMPWQVLWFSPSRRGTKLKGVSQIKSVANTSILLRKILKDVGIAFSKWADKKYFFILGSEKTRTWAPPFIRNFLKNVKKLSDKGGVGIPVPAGFDVKEIGGEVYDGGQILDVLTSMIVGGMKYPRTFLEQGKTQEGDKSWLAWIVSYGKHQEQLRRTIEHQLWARHLYCKFGMEHRVPKQGVPVENQEMEETYIPNMQWRSEGKWHRETKLKMLYGGLNVASPLGPEVKLAFEEDISRTLGYSEINFDPARELLAINQKIEIMERKMEFIKAEMLHEVLERAQKKKMHLKMLPVIQGLVSEEQEQPEKEGEGKEEKPQGPPTQEEKLKARLKGGVSRTPKEPGADGKKGVAKPMKSTRTPKKAEEALEAAEDGELIPEEVLEATLDVAKILNDYAEKLNKTEDKPKLVTPIPQPSEE